VWFTHHQSQFRHSVTSLYEYINQGSARHSRYPPLCRSFTPLINDFDLATEDFQQDARNSVSTLDAFPEENSAMLNQNECEINLNGLCGSCWLFMQRTLTGMITEVSVEVTDDRHYLLVVSLTAWTGVLPHHGFHSIMKCFNIWLQWHYFIPESETVFQENLAENTPLLIIAFIMSEWVPWLLHITLLLMKTSRCDFKNPDGFLKPEGSDPSKTFSHAMKLRSALTYGFGQHYQCGTTPWSQNLVTQRWGGNPSVSVPVSWYMLLLQKRRV